MNTQYAINQVLFLKGCFTEEYCLRGLTLHQIAQELGLPAHRVEKGAFIAFALTLPAFHEFYPGGWAEYSTDKFVEYRKGKMKWKEEQYEATYEGKRMPISVEQVKNAWLDSMKNEKLVKVLPAVPHSEGDDYPPGGLASQIVIVHGVKCLITQFLESNQVFRGIW